MLLEMAERAKHSGLLFVDLLRVAWIEYQRDRAEYLAVAMIYYAIISLVPLVSLFLSTLGLLLRFSAAAADAERKILTGLEGNLGTPILVSRGAGTGVPAPASVRGARLASFLLLSLPLWAQWSPLGPFGGSASVVAADPNSPRTLLAGTRNALLFRTSDGGTTWIPLAFPAQLQATLNTLVVDPTAAGVYLAGLTSDVPRYSGLLRSTDGGATWRQAPELRGRQVRAIAFYRGDPKIAAAGTDTGVFQSQDGGATWDRISPEDNTQLRPIVALAFDPKDSSRIYAGTPHLPWTTVDGGVTWNTIHRGMIDDSDVFSIQVDRNRPARVFASACSGIYRSLDGGGTWKKLVGAKDASYRTYVIVQDPQYENEWFAGTTHGMVRSTNGGVTWERIGPFATRSIAFDAARLGRIYIATEEAGILRSDDSGKTWVAVNRGFCNRRLSSLWTMAESAYTAILDGPMSGLTLRLAADLSDWEELPPTQEGSMEPAHYAERLESGQVSGEAGWELLKQPAVSACMRALTTGWLAGIVLTNEGRSWRLCLPVGGEVFSIVPTGGKGLLAATSAGLRASDDMGTSWHPVRGELGTNTVQAICRHPQKPGMLFAAKFGAIYSSMDGGRSWLTISPPSWPVSSVRQLAVMPGSPDRLLVLTQQQGVWGLPLDSGRPGSSTGSAEQ